MQNILKNEEHSKGTPHSLCGVFIVRKRKNIYFFAVAMDVDLCYNKKSLEVGCFVLP